MNLIIHYLFFYHFILWSNGYVYFKGNGTSGNKGFMDGQLLSMELNCNAGTLHFFVDSK